ncbi:MAG: DUF721 domain-containing protein [Gaiellaceae bacterium]
MERIGKQVERELSVSGGGTALALSEITAAWPEAVGEAVARQAWPLRVGRDGTLHVATTSSTWAFELDRLSPEIEARLAGLVGPSAPTKLRFRVGPVPEPAGPADERLGGSEEPLRTTPETAAAAAAAAAEIEDPELRELVARAARASLARARSGRRF